jgi:hypothetical protein
MSVTNTSLYRAHELAIRTQYAELKERARSTMPLLRGTPGTLVQRTGSGRGYWYRVYQSAAGTQVEELVCKDGDEPALIDARAELSFAQWARDQVRDLRKLEFQVADKSVASVLVELRNKGLLDAGLIVVGTLGYMAWLNELGARVVAARTQDIDLAARQRLKLAAPQSFLEALAGTRLGFTPVPGMPTQKASTSVKLKGRDGLRVDVLTHGDKLGATVAVPPLMWHAQAVPHFDYLLHQPRQAAVLAGGHCIPVLLPQASRLVWHKLYASASRRSFPEKAMKDLTQAVTLAAVLTEQEDESLADSFGELPAAMRVVVRKRLPAACRALSGHTRARAALEQVLA